MNKIKKIDILEIKDNKIPKGIYCYSLLNEETKKEIYYQGKKIKISFPMIEKCCFLKKNNDNFICSFLENKIIEDDLKECDINVNN